MNTTTVIALIIFGVTYIFMMAFQKLRPYVVWISALLFVILGSFSVLEGFSYSVLEAVEEIDWNVLMMICGTMGTVYLFIESDMPQLLSEKIISHMPNVKLMVVVMSLFAGIISAFVDNVATVLMIAPVALAICKKLDISPVPTIICIAVSSNLQGAATLVGDTTSILLAKAANLDFLDFFVDEGKAGMFWVTEAGALASALIILWMFRKENDKISMSGETTVDDKVPTIMLVGTVVALIAASFIPYEENALPGQFYKPACTNGFICIAFFAICALYECLRQKSPKPFTASLKEIDYYTLALLAGLFIVIGGISRAGVIEALGEFIAGIGGDGSIGSVFLIYTVIVWISVALSAFIDNIPYTATMLPVVAVIAQELSAKGDIAVPAKLLYYGLLCGATLGGNLTPIGASANIAALGILRKEGHEVKNATFMKYGVPFTLSAVITGYLLIWLIWM